MKPLPFTVTVVAVAPRIMVEGDREVIAGTGFSRGEGGAPPPPQAETKNTEVISRKAAFAGFISVHGRLLRSMTKSSWL